MKRTPDQAKRIEPWMIWVILGYAFSMIYAIVVLMYLGGIK